MTRKPRILIAEDHEVVRAGLRQAVEEATGWEVCGEASNGREAVRMAAELEPDVVILDIGMPELNGLEATRQIVRNHPECGVLILTMHDSDGLARDVMTAGAMGYVLKSDPVGDIVEALRAVDTRTPFVSRRLKQAASPRSPARRGDRTRQLTPREREILQLIAEGRSSKEIAGELHISLRTVDTHRTNIMRKLDLHSAAELVRYAIRNRIALP